MVGAWEVVRLLTGSGKAYMVGKASFGGDGIIWWGRLHLMVRMLSGQWGSLNAFFGRGMRFRGLALWVVDAPACVALGLGK